MIDRTHLLSLTRQAEAVGFSRGSVYYLPRPVSDADLALMRRIDALHLEHPFAGARMLRDLLALDGITVGRKHVGTLMRRMGRAAIHCGHNPERRTPPMAIDIKNLNHIQLGELIDRAQARQLELKKENAGKVRAKIAAMVKAEGLDIDDVMGTRRKSRTGSGGKVAPKYRNPADPSQTWSGRGRQPLWYVAAVKSGKKDKNLLIK